MPRNELQTVQTNQVSAPRNCLLEPRNQRGAGYQSNQPFSPGISMGRDFPRDNAADCSMRSQRLRNFFPYLSLSLSLSLSVECSRKEETVWKTIETQTRYSNSTTKNILESETTNFTTYTAILQYRSRENSILRLWKGVGGFCIKLNVLKKTHGERERRRASYRFSWKVQRDRLFVFASLSPETVSLENVLIHCPSPATPFTPSRFRAEIRVENQSGCDWRFTMAPISMLYRREKVGEQ